MSSGMRLLVQIYYILSFSDPSLFVCLGKHLSLIADVSSDRKSQKQICNILVPSYVYLFDSCLMSYQNNYNNKKWFVNCLPIPQHVDYCLYHCVCSCEKTM